MARVLNKYIDEIPSDAVYIGRPSKWGNPFVVGSMTFSRDRLSAVEAYARWIDTQPELRAAAKEELKGKDLVCFCEPKPCHGRVLLRIANEE